MSALAAWRFAVLDILSRAFFMPIFINRARNVAIERFATSGGNARAVGHRCQSGRFR